MTDYEAELKALDMVFSLIEKMFGAADTLINQLKNRQSYIELAGLEALHKHIEGGGKLLSVILEPEDSDGFTEMLKERHLPFTVSSIKQEDGTEKVAVIFRDKDEQLVKQTILDYQEKIAFNSKEVDFDTFSRLVRGNEFAEVSGLSKVEVHAFREAAEDKGMKYCVLQDEKAEDKYRIVSTDELALKKTVGDMYYNLAGENGHKYAEGIREAIDSEMTFKDRLDAPCYVVDVDNPRNFIYVDEKQWSTHSLVAEKETQLDGTEINVLFDKKHKVHELKDKSDIVKSAKHLRKPVIMSVADFAPIISGISPAGEAVISNDFTMKGYEKFVSAHKTTKGEIIKRPKRNQRYTKNNLKGYVNMPRSVANRIMQAGIPNVICIDKEIAFPSAYSEQVDKFLDENVYKDFSPFQRLNAKMLTMGKGYLDMARIRNGETRGYILNPDRKEFVLTVDKEGMHIFQNGKEAVSKAITDPDFEDTLFSAMENIDNPVILDQSEYESMDKFEIIAARANDEIPNAAIDYMLEIEEREKAEVGMVIISGDDLEQAVSQMDLSVEQKEAIKRTKEANVSVHMSDGAIFDEMRDLAINKDLETDIER